MLTGFLLMENGATSTGSTVKVLESVLAPQGFQQPSQTPNTSSTWRISKSTNFKLNTSLWGSLNPCTVTRNLRKGSQSTSTLHCYNSLNKIQFCSVSTLIFIPCSEYICLQKCCPYDQQFDLNSFKCTQKTLAKPLGINSLDSQTALDYFLFEKLDNCHFVKLLHSNLGVDRLYLTNKGKLVQRVLQGFTETPPSRLYHPCFTLFVYHQVFCRFCVDHFVNGRLWGVNGFLCNEDEEENSHHCLPDFKYLSKKNRKNGNNVTFIPNLTLIVVLSVLSSVQSDCFYLIFWSVTKLQYYFMHGNFWLKLQGYCTVLLSTLNREKTWIF